MLKGKLQIETVGSAVLKGNPLGDPHVREVPVYLPPSYGRARGARYPVIFYLAGFTGNGRSVVNYSPWKENLVERLDRLIAARKVPECVLVLPDCFTAYGGSQYLNSEATGRYEDHVVQELVAFVADKFSLARGPEGRALMGKSSGGFGALTLAMRHPDVFAHAVSHSGDMFFEVCYGRDVAKFVTLLGKYGGSAKRFVEEFRKAKDKNAVDHVGVNMIAMAACYSPNPKSALGFDLPFDSRTGEMDAAAWARWKKLDPVSAAARYRANLKRLKTLYFDCGVRDEFYLHLGARKFSDVLKKLGVAHIHEEHPFGHFDMSERYERSLILLGRRLRAA